jgi:hypothetical protein
MMTSQSILSIICGCGPNIFCFCMICIVLNIGQNDPVYGQSLENIGNGKAFGVSGGINARNVFYRANVIEGRRDPYNYFLSGNLNFGIYDWSVPLSFTYSNQQTSFYQPFNQYGLSPSYKWITLHGGYRSMMFSNYTVAGHIFLGGGFDITPSEKIRVSAFYGRLLKAVKEDTLKKENLPSYERMGGGFKVTLGGKMNYVDLIVFKAHDNVRSLPTPPVLSDVRPQENLVGGLGFGIAFAERLIWKGEAAFSAITKDTRAETIHAGSFYDKLGFAFTPRASSSYSQAFKSTVEYALKNAGIGLAYERIDPGYMTLGAYYFNNDLERFSFTSSAILFQKKARMNAQLGIQRNNLNQDEFHSMRRLSGSVNFNYQIYPRFLCNVSYSNFRTVINFRSQFDYLNQVTPYENLDTLNFRQIAQNANMNMNYVLNESKQRKHNITANLAVQTTADVQASVDQPSGATFYNLNCAYTIIFGDKNITVNLAVNANQTRSYEAQNKIYGPNASVRKSFFDRKLSTNATISYNNSFVNNELTSKVINLRLSGNFTLKKKHQFDLQVAGINRYSARSEIPEHFTELTVQIGYAYNFNID